MGFVHISSSWVESRLHTAFQLPRLPGSRTVSFQLNPVGKKWNFPYLSGLRQAGQRDGEEKNVLQILNLEAFEHILYITCIFFFFFWKIVCQEPSQPASDGKFHLFFDGFPN